MKVKIDDERVPRSSYADFSEWRPTGAGLSMRASSDGVLLKAVQVDRVLGHDQIRTMAQMMLKAADEAQNRGAPSHLMES